MSGIGTEKNMPLAELLKSHVYRLAHEIGDRSVFSYDKLVEAQDYITQKFESYGYRPECQGFRTMGKTVQNIVVTKPGLRLPQEIIILGAHYDTCDNPGADDNASAVAGLLELSRLMSTVPTDRSLKFIAFVNEEPPFFRTSAMGSLVYAKSATQRKENIKAALVFEMIGYYTQEPDSQQYPPFLSFLYPNKGNFIAVVGNFYSRWLVNKVTWNFKKQTQFPIESLTTFSFVPGVDLSDHWSFWKENYPAVMITDTAFYRYPHYHSDSDTYDKLSYESMAEVVIGFQRVLTALTSQV
ncbi:MAG: M28 family peptidase [Candidatus Omnitrophica bacterium]|nr:M28 family peptidase [Candidatus Omnitrophota bacterium]